VASNKDILPRNASCFIKPFVPAEGWEKGQGSWQVAMIRENQKICRDK
jgi:hypothetical protein